MFDVLEQPKSKESPPKMAKKTHDPEYLSGSGYRKSKKLVIYGAETALRTSLARPFWEPQKDETGELAHERR